MTSKEVVNYLIELVEKDTPKKVEISTLAYYQLCPNCKTELNKYFENKYCKECGQRLDWSKVR